MRIVEATFRISAANAAQFPTPGAPEVAFVGRSNVGKSSLLNVLVGVRGLAKTSQTPGRTRLLNWFDVVPDKGSPLAFVDLPGFGYAKVAKAAQKTWQALIESYFTQRAGLVLAVVLIDIRRGAETEERQLLEWLAHLGKDALVIATKADKLVKSARIPAAEKIKHTLHLKRTPMVFSSHTGDGTKEIWSAIMRAAAHNAAAL